jgi:hypothetical protein
MVNADAEGFGAGGKLEAMAFYKYDKKNILNTYI